MKKVIRPENREHLKACRENLKQAYATGDQHQICVAMSQLGLAFFGVRKYEEGLEMLDEAIDLASGLADPHLQAHSIGLKVLAYQDVGRLPDAFQTAGEILGLAEAHNDSGLKVDALASQAQVLLDSGDLDQAGKIAEKALQIATDSADKRRMMNVNGVLGHIALTKAVVDDALMYFQTAWTLANEVGDEVSAYGYLGNKGLVLAWKGDQTAAAEVFEQVLPFVRERKQTTAEINALRHLAKVSVALERNARVLELTERGLELAEATGDVDASYDFYQYRAMVYYRRENLDAAQATLEDAVALAKQNGDARRELDYLVSLGESLTLSEIPARAESVYRRALALAEEQERNNDRAYLTARLALALAESDRLDQAVPLHEEALALARRYSLAELEGEQLCMLALAAADQADSVRATNYAQHAIDVFERADLKEDAARARALLANLVA